MPNGDLDSKTRAELDGFFAPIAGALESFAEKHNLKLERYYHDAPSWHFIFKHPEGGVGKIDVSRSGEKTVRPSLAWWIDDYDRQERHVKLSTMAELPTEGAVILTELEAGLRLVLSWKLNQWNKTYGGYGMWKKTSKEEFQRLTDQYPFPQ